MAPQRATDVLPRLSEAPSRQQLVLLLSGLLYVAAFLSVAPILVLAPWAALAVGAAMVLAQSSRLRAPGVLRAMSLLFGYGLCAVAIYVFIALAFG